jgi:ribosomal protein S12 methylthiotransferase accessory factor
MLQRLAAAVAGRFSLIAFGEASCPVHCLAAVPNAGEEEGPGWLPKAARPASRRAAVGRGTTAAEAALSCLGEAAELVSACHWGDEPVVRATLAGLGGRAVSPGDLLLLSRRQFAEAERASEQVRGAARLPLPFDAGEAIDWVETGPVGGGPARLVPAAFAYIGYPGAEERWRSYAGSSNGCAAGETIEAATVAGFLELVERDAAAIWWYGRHRRPAVDVAGLPLASDIVRWLAEEGRECRVLDISTDLGVPAVAAISARADCSDLTLGFAARFEPRAAVEAALTELCQQVLARRLGASATDTGRRAQVDARALDHLEPSGIVDVDDLRCAVSSTTGLARSVEVCERHGLELLAIDLTRGALAVPVVRAVVPGLRHTQPNFAPGRLYEVPASLGWERRGEDDLNPLPLPG